jgi:hypothetical protein
VNPSRRTETERISLGLLAVVCVWTLAVGLTGSTDFLLYAAPALLIAFPLAFGRYVGEDAIARLKGLAPRRPRPAAALLARGVRREPRVRPGGLLIAASLAGRAPPASPTLI